MPVWDPVTYLEFADERSRPFLDLLSRVKAAHPRLVVDLGCGPGQLTASLADRWPDAQILGLDSSPEMIKQAAEFASQRVSFQVQDLRDWRPATPVDVIISNATLQWVPGHRGLLPDLVNALSQDGWLAFQVPGNFGEPTHTELAAVRTSQRWQPVLGDLDLPQPAVEEPVEYVRRMTELGCAVDAWETTYLQVLPGPDAVLEWMKGTGLRPVLSALADEQQEEFVAEYAERLRAAYPQESFGTVLPYRRIFVVATRGGG